ncbi:MAG: AhpC/TSA family protein [Acidimicrobiales bacterium]
MRDRLDELTTASGRRVDVVVMTFTRPRNLPGYFRRFTDPIPVATDPERTLYRAIGFGRGSLGRVWGLRAVRRYIALLRSGQSLERKRIDSSGEDTRQLGGDVLVDADGAIVWVFKGAGPDDRPDVEELLAQVRLLP